MQLNIKQRFALRSIFKPQATSLFEADLLDGFYDKIKITAKEAEKLNMRSEGGSTTWDADKDKGLEVEFSGALLKLFQTTVKEADEQKKIPYDPDDKSIYELAKHILNGDKDK